MPFVFYHESSVYHLPLLICLQSLESCFPWKMDVNRGLGVKKVFYFQMSHCWVFLADMYTLSFESSALFKSGFSAFISWLGYRFGFHHYVHLESRLSPAKRCSSAQQSLVIRKQPRIYACETAWAHLLTLYILSHFVMYWMWPHGIREYLSVLTEELLLSLFKAWEHEPRALFKVVLTVWATITKGQLG